MQHEAQDLLTIVKVLEAYDQPARQRMVQYLVGQVGLMPVITREYERARKADQRDMSGILSGTEFRDTAQSPTPIAVMNGFKSSPKIERLLTQEARDKAKGLLQTADYEFLDACPEPFRSQWLIDPEWWISLRDGYPRVDAQRQASRYMAWEGARRKRDHRAALRNWISKADRWREQDEMRKAVRR